MKKILILAIGLLLTACVSNPDPIVEEPPIDLTNLYAQVCEKKEGPCTKMMCALKNKTYHCAENIGAMTENCGVTHPLDEIITQYKICGTENAEPLRIFNYAQNLEALSHGTPAELEKKIETEVAKVESGGSSNFLGTVMASAGGAVIGGLISNALFGRSNAMPPRAPASGYEQPLNKNSFAATKDSVATNDAIVKDSATKTQKKSQAKTKAAAAKKKRATATKSKKRRKSTRRRR